jgi:hypothetical protein
MKLTKTHLKQLIKEELGKVLKKNLDPEKVRQAQKDARLDVRDDADRGDRWEFDEPEYLDTYMDAYKEAMRDMDREY